MSEGVTEALGTPGTSAVRVGLTLGGIVLGAVVIFSLGVMEGSRVTELVPAPPPPPNALPTENLAPLPAAPRTPAAPIPPDKLTFYDRLSGVAPSAPVALPVDQPPAQGLAPASAAAQAAPAPQALPPQAAVAAAPRKPPVPVETAARTTSPSKSDPAAQIRKLAGKGRFTVQVAAVSDRSAAAEAAARVKRNGFDAVTVMASVKGKTFYRIRVGSYPTKEAAAQAAGIFRSAYGLDAIPAEQ